MMLQHELQSSGPLPSVCVVAALLPAIVDVRIFNHFPRDFFSPHHCCPPFVFPFLVGHPSAVRSFPARTNTQQPRLTTTCLADSPSKTSSSFCYYDVIIQMLIIVISCSRQGCRRQKCHCQTHVINTAYI